MEDFSEFGLRFSPFLFRFSTFDVFDETVPVALGHFPILGSFILAALADIDGFEFHVILEMENVTIHLLGFFDHTLYVKLVLNFFLIFF